MKSKSPEIAPSKREEAPKQIEASHAESKDDEVDGAAIVDEYDIIHAKLDPKTLDEKERKLYDVHMSILEFELKHQDGIELQTDRIAVPGRLSITLCSLLEILAIITAFSASFIHFAFYSRNYVLAVFVVACVSFVHVVLYDSSYRTRRIALSILQVIGLCIFMALVDWAFLDIIFNPSLADQKKFLLVIATLCYNFVPLFMILHVFYFGRGYRTLKVKRKKPKVRSDDVKTGKSGEKDPA